MKLCFVRPLETELCEYRYKERFGFRRHSFIELRVVVLP